MEHSLPGEKRRLREALSLLPPPTSTQQEAVLAGLERWLVRRRPQVVVGFLAMVTEIDFTPLVSRIPSIRFALTRTAPGRRLSVHPFSAPRERHQFGFEQPAAGAPELDPADIDVVLVPGLAFTADGRRLGRGAGYYDRFLGELVGAATVGLTVEDRVVGDLPREPHDVRVTHLATELGVRQTVAAR